MVMGELWNKYKNYVKEKSGLSRKDEGMVSIKNVVLAIVFGVIGFVVFMSVLPTMLTSINTVVSNSTDTHVLGSAGVSILDIVPLILVIVLVVIVFELFLSKEE